MKIKINREALKVTVNGEVKTVESVNNGGDYYFTDGESLTRAEIKKIADVNAIDEVIEQIRAKESGLNYVDDSGNYISEKEYEELTAEFDADEYERVEWL